MPVLCSSQVITSSKPQSAAVKVAPARQLAYRILLRVATAGGYASDLLLSECAGLPARDAALTEIIVFGCLRLQSQIDYLIDRYSGRPQPKLDPEVRIALRMGIFQLRYLDRIPRYAAVSESVELVKCAGKRSAAGFANAVLRKANRDPVTWPDFSIEASVPTWLWQKWQTQFGLDAARAIALAALEQPVAHFNESTGRQQDIGAQSIVPLLGVEPGMNVLDLCAAPGNKTAQLLALGALVTACDRSPVRLAAVPSAARRVVLEATRPLPFGPVFDRVLVDAPCSGTGTLARNPEIKWRLQMQDLSRFHNMQRQILTHALMAVKPGGKLVYATCSLEREENEDVVSGTAIEKTHLRLPGRDHPEGEQGDGFFAAVIEC